MQRVVSVLIGCLAAAPAFAQAPATDAQCQALAKLALPHATITQAASSTRARNGRHIPSSIPVGRRRVQFASQDDTAGSI